MNMKNGILLFCFFVIKMVHSAPTVVRPDWKLPQTAEELKPRPKIVGGREVDPPFKYSEWIVAIMRYDYQFCAGSLFAENLMVTAAHFDDLLDCSVLGIPYDELRIAAHRHNLSTSSEQENGIILQVKKITVHPNFNHFTLDNDIAVWELEGGDQMPANRSVRLDNGKNSFPGRNGTVLGWGDIEEGGDTSEVLRELSVTMLSNERCRSMLGPVITDGMLCAGGEEGRDACQGDSGGPMVVMRNFDRPVLVGVVSWGQGCARGGYPGVYTRISQYRTWLRKFMGPEDLEMDSTEDGEEANMDDRAIDEGNEADSDDDMGVMNQLIVQS